MAPAFIPQNGQPFTPGEYEGIAELSIFFAKPGVRLEGPGHCEPAEGRFVVHEVEYAGEGIVRFAADFEQRCADTTTVLRGWIRINAGDEPCDAGPNGTPCNDRDACSATSACHAGRCVGAALTACDPAPDTCHDAAVCDPGAGACLEHGVRVDGTACDDGDACTLYDRCTDGACAGSWPETCSDSRSETYDLCDPASGCVFPNVPGTDGRPGVPSTFIFLTSGADDTLGNGVTALLRPTASGSISFSRDDASGVTFSAYGGFDRYGSTSVSITPPSDGPLLPGVYEDVTDFFTRVPGKPGMLIFASNYCDVAERRLVVHEYAGPPPPDDGRGFSFAADFEVRCANSEGTFAGALRWRAGDASCGGAPDGTACDDRNACTATSACRDGLCVGNDPVVCPDAPACNRPSVCDPRSGACVAGGALDDYTSCADVAACVPEGTCVSGRCIMPAPPCDDANVCTADRCDGAGGCVHDPIAGTCWGLRGTTVVTASALGASCSCTLRGRPGTIALLDDGTFARPGGMVSCNGRLVDFPPERGTWSATRRSRLALETTNLEELIDAAAVCGTSSQPPRSRTWLKLARDGTRLRGLDIQRSRSGQVRVRIVTKFVGTPTTTSQPGQVPRGLNACAQQLGDCLRDKLD